MDIEHHPTVSHSFTKPDSQHSPDPKASNPHPVAGVGGSPNNIEPPKEKTRCFKCNKRLGLMPFNCKCGAVTCVRCKWPEHDCSFDYRAEAQEQLKKANPAVVADKLSARI